MKTSILKVALLGPLLLLAGCKELPGGFGTAAAGGSHRFQCHPVSPGPCAYAVFNESGSVRETFILAPGESRVVGNMLAHTTFCLAVEKPLDPSKCQRLGLDGRPVK